MGPKEVTAYMLVLGLVLCSVGLVVLTKLQLSDSVQDISMSGSDATTTVCLLSNRVTSVWPCNYSYGIAAASVLGAILVATVQCLTCRCLSKVGPFMDLVLAMYWFALWMGACVLFTWFGSEANSAGVPHAKARNIFIFINYLGMTLSAMYMIVCTNMMLVCCRSMSAQEHDLEAARAVQIKEKEQVYLHTKGKGKAADIAPYVHDIGAVRGVGAMGPPSDSGSASTSGVSASTTTPPDSPPKQGLHTPTSTASTVSSHSSYGSSSRQYR